MREHEADRNQEYPKGELPEQREKPPENTFKQGVFLAIFLIVILYLVLLATGGNTSDDLIFQDVLFLLMGFVQFPFLAGVALLLFCFRQWNMAKGLLTVSVGYLLLTGTCGFFYSMVG